MQTAADDVPDSIPTRHGWLWWCCLLLAWLVTLSLAIVAGLRIFYHDGANLLIWLNAFTRYVYLPAYACLTWALWQRRWGLALGSLAVVACHLTWLAPEVLRDRRFDRPASSAATATNDSRTIRILFANVKANHSDPLAFVHDIPAIDPDIIVFVEYYPWWDRDVAQLPIFKPYPYGQAAGQRAGGEFGVFSKLPIKNAQRLNTVQPMSYTFQVDVDGTPLTLFCLHAPRPMGLPGRRGDYYKSFWNGITPQLLALPDPAVIVGDFNATPHSLVYQTLTATHLRSAHDDRGRGYATTWPNGDIPVPPIRIDQALILPGVECVQISEGRGRGSDHKPLILDIRIRGK